MAANNFQQWNPSQSNQETDSAYSSDALRSAGATNPSVFSSALANKLFYQLSTFVTALAQALATKGYAMSDASLSALAGTLANVMTAADLLPYAPLANPALTGVPTAPTPNLADNSTALATTAFIKALNYQGALGFTPVQQGGGGGQNANKVYLGYNGVDGLNLQIDGNSGYGKLISANMVPASLVQAGYTKLASGAIIQWGHGLVPVGATTVYNYPIAWPTQCWSVVVCQGSALPTAGPANGIGTDNLSKTQFQITIPGASGNSVGVYWIAIGY